MKFSYSFGSLPHLVVVFYKTTAFPAMYNYNHKNFCLCKFTQMLPRTHVKFQEKILTLRGGVFTSSFLATGTVTIPRTTSNFCRNIRYCCGLSWDTHVCMNCMNSFWRCGLSEKESCLGGVVIERKFQGQNQGLDKKSIVSTF